MSQVEIDKAKRLFDFSMESAIRHIKKISEVNTNVKPNFFKYVVENKEKGQFIGMETPMDYVYEEVKSIKQAKRSRNKPITELINIPATCPNRNQITKIKISLEEYKKEKNSAFAT